MGLEIEYKFLVAGDGWRDRIESAQRLEQGYLAYGPDEVRVRLIDGERGTLTVKGPKQADGLTRTEDEVAIPAAAARALLDRSLSTLVKTRYRVPGLGVTWEVDVYGGSLSGLVVAEAEVPSAETMFKKEPWVGEDVSSDKAYSNGRLAQYGWPAGLAQARREALAETFRRLGGVTRTVDAERTTWGMPSGQLYVSLPHPGAFCEQVGRETGPILTGPEHLVSHYLDMTLPQAKAWLADPNKGTPLTTPAPAPSRPRPR